jgi:Uma2 family endonuclease
MASMSSSPAVAVRPLTRVQYRALIDAGLLDDEPVELLGGRMVEMSPERAEHAEGVDLTGDLLRPSVQSAGLRVRIAHPIWLGDLDEPEPDVAVVVNRSYAHEHPGPEDIRLLVEVSVSSLAKDLGEKAATYAAAGVPEYWVAMLARRRVRVHRRPGPDGYAEVFDVEAGQSVAPLALPDVALDPAHLPEAEQPR